MAASLKLSCVSDGHRVGRTGIDLPTSLKSGDDGANESTLQSVSIYNSRSKSTMAHLDAIGLDSNEAISEVSFTANTGWVEGSSTTYVCSLDMVLSLSLACSSL